MLKNLKLTLVVAVVAALAVAGVAVAAKNKPTVVRQGNLQITLNGGFSPTKLPKHQLSPITFNVEGKLATLDNTHPPAIKQVILETDKNGAINAKGLPVCKQGQLAARDTKSAEKACPDAIVGSGTTTAEILFPEQKPINVPSKLLLFNGGVKGGTTTLFVHAYFKEPVNGALVATVKVQKHKNGRYGIKSVTSVPVLAGGNGSPTAFTLKIHRTFTYKGKKQSFLMAQCPDGHLNAQAEAVFYKDPTKLKGHVVRACTPKG